MLRSAEIVLSFDGDLALFRQRLKQLSAREMPRNFIRGSGRGLALCFGLPLN